MREALLACQRPCGTRLYHAMQSAHHRRTPYLAPKFANYLLYYANLCASTIPFQQNTQTSLAHSYAANERNKTQRWRSAQPTQTSMSVSCPASSAENSNRCLPICKFMHCICKYHFQTQMMIWRSGFADFQNGLANIVRHAS